MTEGLIALVVMASSSFFCCTSARQYIHNGARRMGNAPTE